MRRKLFSVVVATALVLVAAGAAAAANGGFTPPTAHSPNAQRINDAYYLILGFTAFIFVLVEGVLLLFVVKYRSRGRGREVDGFQIHGHTRTELIWTAGPVLILAVIASFVFYKLPGITGVPQASAADQLQVTVEGRQFYWQFTYPNGAVSVDTLHVPVGEVVRLNVISRDVDHSWWIFELGGKWDAIPGHPNHTWFKVDQPGTYEGTCAELCGLQHAAMRAWVVAEPRDVYDRWVSAQKQKLDTGSPALGQEVAAGVCAKCHYFNQKQGTLVGPNLANNARLIDLNGLTTLVRNGGVLMPAVGKYWSDAQIRALVAYFKQQSGGASGGQG
ncbi:MAG TPA: cytochrome c oxidase subunit II [Gaiellaceae bacterium]|nr:cytochrome c oxidase subunit II [Gaiellaceae bacterium]